MSQLQWFWLNILSPPSAARKAKQPPARRIPCRTSSWFLFLLFLSLNILPHKCRSALMRSAALIRIYWNRHARIHSAYTKWIVNAKQLYCSKMLENGKGNWSQMLFRVFDRTSYPVRFFCLKAEGFHLSRLQISKYYTILCVTFRIVVFGIKWVFKLIQVKLSITFNHV